MPTGYTADIEKGISFEEFVWNCARAFGALVSMREDSMDAPIPDNLPVDTYHQKELKREIEELHRLENMTETEAKKQSKLEYDKSMKEWQKSRERNALLKNKYETMLNNVKEWKPPTSDHVGMKEFMIQQITESIKFDCGEYPAPKPLIGWSSWLDDKIAWTRKDIAYHEKEWAEEQERTKNRNEWLSALRQSVPQPKKKK